MRSTADDLTTRARIRDAALELFPAAGYAGTTIRSVAAEAGVSPALVLHHFGSKEGLQRACDDYVLRLLDEQKRKAIENGTHRQAGAVAAAYELVAPALRYLAWTLSTGSETAARIFDEWLDDVTRQLIEAAEAGMVTNLDEPRRQAAVLVAMQLGGMVLHEHLSRALGVDVLTAEGMIVEAPYALRLFKGELFDHQILDEAAETVSELQDNLESREELAR